MIERFVDAREDAEEDVLQITSIRQMMEVCKQFKKMLLSARAEVEVARDDANFHGGTFQSSRGGEKSSDLYSGDYDPRKQAYVGVAEPSKSGFSLGVAPSNSRPLASVDLLLTPATLSSNFQQKSTIEAFRSPSSPKSYGTKGDFNLTSSPVEQLSRDEQGVYFEAFAATDGAELHGAFVDAKAKTRELKAKCKESSLAVNNAKVLIDDLQSKMQVRKESRIELLKKSGFKAAEAEEIVDEEELALMRDLKEAKRSYKASFESFQRHKLALSEAEDRNERAKNDLGQGFIAWMHSKIEDKDFYPESTDETSDTLDNQEAFDRMEAQRILARFPDSLAFFNAQKMRKALLTQNGATIRQAKKNKRQV
jgi:hypothetical protein